jgi:hypothetical protein
MPRKKRPSPKAAPKVDVSAQAESGQLISPGKLETPRRLKPTRDKDEPYSVRDFPKKK